MAYNVRVLELFSIKSNVLILNGNVDLRGMSGTDGNC